MMSLAPSLQGPVQDRVNATNASRAQFLGFAFAFTFFISAASDAVVMGTLRNHGLMIAQFLGCLASTLIVRWTAFGRRHAGGICALGIGVVTASGAAHLSQFGAFDGPYFYGSYVAPPIFITLLLPLSSRILATYGTSLAFTLIYWMCRPDLFTYPAAHIPMLYLLTVSSISIGIGHHVYRLEVRSFADNVRFEVAATELEEQLRAVEPAPIHLRHEIARQLHDDVAQLITSARVHLDGWSREGSENTPAARVASLLDQLAHRARRIMEELRTPPERGPLEHELFRLRSEYAELGLTVDVLIDESVRQRAFDHAPVEVLAASAREALTNSVRHGGATEATLSVHAMPNLITLEVFDNGRGTVLTVSEGYGLLGIRERVQVMGGTAELSDYEEGLRLSITLPVREPRPSARIA